MQSFHGSTVLPHGRLIRIADDIVAIEGTLRTPIGDQPHRMTVVRLADGRLVVFSPIALDDHDLRALEEFGTPAFLIVPGALHRLDARLWKERYPDLTVVAPPGASDEVGEVVPVDASEVDFGDPLVRFATVAGTDGQEAAILAGDEEGGASLIVDDLVWNLDGRTGVADVMPDGDRDALRAQLEAWASVHGLDRIIGTHGDIVTREPRAVLHRLAESLA